MNAWRELPTADPRVETGAIAFGDDWPGTFIRGDDAMFYAAALRAILKREEGIEWPERHVLANLLDGLESSRINRQPSTSVPHIMAAIERDDSGQEPS